MTFKRASGILLHPTSLHGPYGIGDIGHAAKRWIEFLCSAGSRLWQVLPLGPTGYGDSPYQCFSAFAGNPYLISIDRLLEMNLLHPDNLDNSPKFLNDHVDYGRVIKWKGHILNLAFQNYRAHSPTALKEEFEHFQSKESNWLDDYSLFMAIKEIHGGTPWFQWGKALRQRQPEMIENFRKNHAENIARYAFKQFLFFRQWAELRTHAKKLGMIIIGDIPIFVAHDSSDVWANPELFYLDEKGYPTIVAGVPPDYFSETGQKWGNPLYRWEVHAQDGYMWWQKRMRAVLKVVDIVRLDHFRGFAGYWAIPAGEDTAVNGRWLPGPGADFLQTMLDNLGDLPIIAEDLGEITPDVIKLRDQFDLPGMKILVFAFDGDSGNEFLPHNYIPNCIVYTGTHDNDTVEGWYRRINETERHFTRRYLNCDASNISWDLIRAAWSSVAVFAIAPMQDVLSLDNSARMNYPSQAGGNWTWRMPPDALNDKLRDRLKELNKLYGRQHSLSKIVEDL
jgi:4-alpha-glucanotransferase